jgi:hypothetical protein
LVVRGESFPSPARARRTRSGARAGRPAAGAP